MRRRWVGIREGVKGGIRERIRGCLWEHLRRGMGQLLGRAAMGAVVGVGVVGVTVVMGVAAVAVVVAVGVVRGVVIRVAVRVAVAAAVVVVRCVWGMRGSRVWQRERWVGSRQRLQGGRRRAVKQRSHCWVRGGWVGVWGWGWQ